MPVLMIAEEPNLDEGTYASMLERLMPLLRSANGFMSHAGGPSPALGSHDRDLGVRGGPAEVLQREPEAESPAWTRA